MSESSPPPFIVFRAAKKVTPYERALTLVGLVHELVSKATARFYLKDRLDRAATGLVFALGKAAKTPASLAWREYRIAVTAASEVSTVLDIFAAQRAAPSGELEEARGAIDGLLADLVPRARG